MKLVRGYRAIAAGLGFVGLLAGVVLDAPAALANPVIRDTTAPTTPSNFRQIGTFADQMVLGWDVATDNSGTIDHYSVLADGTQIYRPRSNSVRVKDLVTYCHLTAGRTYSISVLAVDPSGNRSPRSGSIQVTVS